MADDAAGGDLSGRVRDDELRGLTTALLCGLAVGAALGLLLAPRPGPGWGLANALMHPRDATAVIRQRGIRGLLDVLGARRDAGGSEPH